MPTVAFADGEGLVSIRDLKASSDTNTYDANSAHLQYTYYEGKLCNGINDTSNVPNLPWVKTVTIKGINFGELTDSSADMKALGNVIMNGRRTDTSAQFMDSIEVKFINCTFNQKTSHLQVYKIKPCNVTKYTFEKCTFNQEATDQFAITLNVAETGFDSRAISYEITNSVINSKGRGINIIPGTETPQALGSHIPSVLIQNNTINTGTNTEKHVAVQISGDWNSANLTSTSKPLITISENKITAYAAVRIHNTMSGQGAKYVALLANNTLTAGTRTVVADGDNKLTKEIAAHYNTVLGGSISEYYAASITVDGNTTYYDTLADAIAAAANGDTVILLGDLKINTQIDISTGKNIVLDLGGHKLSSDLPTAIKLTNGCLNVENGTIEANGEAFRINGNTSEASLKIASNVEVVSNADCCVFMYGGGAKLFTSGNLTSKGVYATIQGNGLASSAGTLIDISGGKITHSDSVAIYHPQNGIMNITGGVIEGSTGIYFKSGSLNITGGTIKGEGNKAEFVHNGNGCNSTGDGLVIEACDYPGGHPTVNISGGTFTSDHADAIGYYEYQGNSMSNKKFISGGKFTPAVNNDYLAPGVVQDSNGNVYKPYYGGSIPTDSLKTVRTEAIKAMTDYVNPADYEEAQQAEIKTIVDNAKKNIEAAKTADEIKAIEAAAKAELDKLETAEEMALIRTIEGTQFTARSKATTLNGKKAIRVTWNKPADLDFDGYEIYRSTERYKGYGTEPFFTTTNQKYTNNKGLKVGKTYYYKVRGFKYVNDEKVYTEYSLKAWRTVK